MTGKHRLTDSEPLRVRLYPVLVALVGLLVAYGAVSGETAPYWLALITGALGAPAVESARNQVRPTSKDAPEAEVPWTEIGHSRPTTAPPEAPKSRRQ